VVEGVEWGCSALGQCIPQKSSDFAKEPYIIGSKRIENQRGGGRGQRVRLLASSQVPVLIAWATPTRCLVPVTWHIHMCAMTVVWHILKHIETHCHTLQHTAKHCSIHALLRTCGMTHLCVLHDRVMQVICVVCCIYTHYNTLQQTATHCNTYTATHIPVPLHVAYKLHSRVQHNAAQCTTACHAATHIPRCNTHTCAVAHELCMSINTWNKSRT